MLSRTVHLARTRVVNTGDSSRFFPANHPKWDWATEITFQIRITGTPVTGSPTAWSVTAKFQKGVVDTTNYYDSTPTWLDFDALDITNRIVGGVGWYSGSHTPPTGNATGVIADNTDSFPITIERTIIRPPALCRVVLQPTYTGGTSPTFTVANVLALARG